MSKEDRYRAYCREDDCRWESYTCDSRAKADRKAGEHEGKTSEKDGYSHRTTVKTVKS